MTRTSLPAARADRRFNRHILWWFAVGYPVLYALGYMSKSVAGPAAIWPAHALAFAAFMLLPLRGWPLIVIGMVAWELLARTLLFLITTQSYPSLSLTATFAFANILTTLGPAAIARMLRLFRRQDRFALVISPLWIIALVAGALPGAFLGAGTSAY